ncbi:RagB/SusD family nutrient uptake outer membrane protein [Fulvivirga sediminis]|uniref:RagB/SusD family nutrient uptake outer membrane protein n=1 Tax=Fulvivirga sediminis TaxID=2803949 RepID=A0A937F6D6_9BACT|nr:RagB/SusD family nutrient uptake outer membrane protein [Fulvivirga sediminis]MBL3655837.1 RagB/SusD family nutrient uptake outer membrane protein [Fulvivirga sediminis]
MKILNITLSIILSIFVLTSCDNDKWLEREPKTIITDDQLWNDTDLIQSLLANYYNRLPALHGLFDSQAMSDLDDALWSGHQDANWHNDFQFQNSYGEYWDYGFIRDINLALDNLDQYGVDLDEQQKVLFKSELRFIRAFVYFELVKRMGGVPIITEQLIYQYDGDASYLRRPRDTEKAVYDFIYTELEDIKEGLKNNNGSKTRANTYTALALESRAMLYAGSIAKYNSQMDAPLTLPGGEVGIPADLAADYYTKSLAASQDIINNGPYSLYNENPDKGANFYDLFMQKEGNMEIIFAKDYELSLKTHLFAYDNIVKSLTEDNESSSNLTPSLNLVESYDYLDGTEGTIHAKNADGSYIAYDNLQDIFANKDGRLYGTVVYPGTTFSSKPVSIQAGVAVWSGSAYEFKVTGNLGQRYEDGGLWTGFDGPVDNARDVSNTGFYMRKFVSEAPGASTRGTGAVNWWPWFRLGEIYLNAAEAALELGSAEGLDYVNALRERAGFPANSITNLTMDIIRKERRVELAFEDHRFFDLKRWRIAHEMWDGNSANEDAVIYGLYPYRVVRPGHEDDGKYIFEKMRPTRFRQPRLFNVSNYYSAIKQEVLNNNPDLIKNPYH